MNLSVDDFPDIVTLAMDNLLYIFDHLDRAKLDNYFLFPIQNAEKKSCDIQFLLIPALFGHNAALQDKALLLLLNSWIIFPPATVDAHKTGHLYTILYTLTWIFVKLFQADYKSMTVITSFSNLFSF